MTGALCAMVSCSNGFYRLERWRKKHHCSTAPSPPKDIKKKCVCKPPFILHTFPTEKKDPNGRKRWTKIVNRQLPQIGEPTKPWKPTKNSRICSEHFPTGAPSKEFPDPCLNLGYNDIRSLRSSEKRKAKTTPTPAPQRKRIHLEDTESAWQEIQQESEIFVHVDHSYAQEEDAPASGSKCEPGPESTHEVELATDNACQAYAEKEIELDLLAAEVKMLTANQKSKQKYDRCDSFINTDSQVRRFTGLQNRDVFYIMLTFLTPRASRLSDRHGPNRVVASKIKKYKKKRRKRQLSIKEEFVMVLMKLRLALENKLLAAIFNTKESTCSRVVRTWVSFLAHELKNLVFWPGKEDLRRTMPAAFALAHPNLRCIMDCSETFLESPQNLKLHSATWSDCKRSNTLKYLVAIAPNGHISFISHAWGGRTTDRHIVQNSTFLDLIEPDDVVMAARGFPIQEDLLIRRASLVFPPSTSGSDQMCKTNVAETKKTANARIHVEQAINRLRWFKIISSRLPVTMAYLFDDILLICAALCNLLPSLIV